MPLDLYIRCGQKSLRCGYTTGTCAALAARAAAEMLLKGSRPETVCVLTPKGIRVEAELSSCSEGDGYCRAGIRKDAGDDRDATDGIEILASVSRTGSGIVIEGGEGIGRVTKPGLDQPVGAAAINSGPREMIRRAVLAVMEECGYNEGLKVVISAPEGAGTASRTFNGILGIEGGISILGTTGIVEPMSERALIASIETAVRQASEMGNRLILTPGNYGKAYISGQQFGSEQIPVVQCSNFIGEALDIASLYPFSEILLIGHVGKLCKLAAGIMNTHSSSADGRREIFCAWAAVCGADRELCKKLMESATTDNCLELLKEAGLMENVTGCILDAMEEHILRRYGGTGLAGALMFSNVHGTLGATETGKKILDRWN